MNQTSRNLVRWSRFLPVALLFVAAPAAASPTFPGEIQYQLGLECAPSCAICHATALGGGKIAKDFGLYMVAAGLREGDTKTVGPALTSLETSMPVQDSDGDGTGDIAELIAQRNPNVPVTDKLGDAMLCGPKYGCGARVATHEPVDGTAIGAAVGFVALLIGLGRRRK